MIGVKIFWSILLISGLTIIPWGIGKIVNNDYSDFVDCWVDGIIIEFVVIFIGLVIVFGLVGIWGKL